MEYHLSTPLTKEKLAPLQAGDTVYLSGVIYTARDAAHKRMFELINAGKTLPIELTNACIYYAGPTPTPPQKAVGSIGPTTAGRMDKYTPLLLRHGLTAVIGKGARSKDVLNALNEAGAVYFGVIGGAGALAASHIEACQIIAWEDLGSEAVRKLTVNNFPLTVLADCHGNDLYTQGSANYLASQKK